LRDVGWGALRGGCGYYMLFRGGGVAPGPHIVPDADAVVPLPSKAYRHPPGDVDRELGTDKLSALPVVAAPFAGQQFR
jgi:hypothetical protein